VGETFERLTVQTFGLNKEIQWMKLNTMEAIRWNHCSSRIIKALDHLIERLSWAQLQVLSPHLVQTTLLIEMLAYVRSHLQKNATIAINVIPTNVAQLLQMGNFYIVHVGGKMVIALDVPFTSYNQAFEVYELKSHPISIPNNDLDSILEVENRYVAIHAATENIVVLTLEQASDIGKVKHHLLRYPIIQMDTEQSCTLAIYLNNVRDAKKFCNTLYDQHL